MAKKFFDNMPDADKTALKESLGVNNPVLGYAKTQLDPLIPCITIKDAGSFSHTGNTVETTVLTKTLPGGVLGLFGAIEIICLVSRSVFVNVTDLNIYINNQKIMGAPIAAGNKSLSTHLFLQNANSLTAQVGKPLGTTGATFGSTSTVVVEATINTVEDMTIDFKIKHTVGTDSAALRGTLIKLWK